MNFDVLSARPYGGRTKETISGIEAVVLPRITTTLPAYHVDFDSKWKHLQGLHLADPHFGVPGPIDVLLGADVFDKVIRHGRRCGFHGSLAALETCFGWVLTGNICHERDQIAACVSTYTSDELLSFNTPEPVLSSEEKTVVQHFHNSYYQRKDGRYVIPLPRKTNAMPLGELRLDAVRRFLWLERSLCAKGQFDEFTQSIEEYFVEGHAEPIPHKEFEKPCREVFYLPMHAVVKP